MSYLGGYQLGDSIPLRLTCRASEAPAMPDNPPQAKVFSGTTVVASHLMPIEDRYAVTAQFAYPLFLDGTFSAGQYTVVYYYAISGTPHIETDSFDVLPGGSVNGSVVSSYFFERPQANYVVKAQEDGNVTWGRNPTI